jgi:short-subunit dehydrogenase
MKARVPLVAAVTTLAGAILATRRGQDDIRGEVAVVTGASRGLGLLLARELARHSCPLVICARDAAELDRAAGQLRAAGAEVTAVACDITDEASPRLLVDTAIERYGRLDILISNAGIIQVGPVQDGQVGLYETALDTMALAPVRLALTGLPVMRRQGHGRIVTIASVGGKLSVPHLLPYSTAKFAAVGFSEGLRAELGRGPVTVTTVVPGLMRTGSHLQARFTGQAGKEFTWFALGASLPLVSMDAERAARQIIGAVRQRRAEVILTPAAQLVSRVAGLAPGLTGEVLHLVQRLALPAPPGPAAQGGEPVPGHELNPALPRKAFDRLTTLGRAAAARFNERSQLSGGIMARADTTRESGLSEVSMLGIYLNDHLAGATAGTELAHRTARSHRDGKTGGTLRRLAAEIAQDRAALLDIMAALGIKVRRYKVGAAWVGEKAGRLKFNGRLLARSPLSDLEELEMLRLGVEGKAAGWRTLRTLAETDTRLDPGRLDELISRAARQADLLEDLRVGAADQVIRGRSA